MVVVALAAAGAVHAQSEMKRNRGESYYRCLSSNTEGTGNIWISLTAVGHIWDDSPQSLKKTGAPREGLWVSNARAFPEARLQLGLSDFAMATFESRPITWAFKVPGWVSGGMRLTIPNNKKLRFFGFGLDGKYAYSFTNTTPTLGGYAGFMPEGYVTKGSFFEGRSLFEFDLLPKVSSLPLRMLLNLGARFPFDDFYRDHYQFLGDVCVVYSGYDFDFFAAYSLEAFNNFAEPRRFTNYDGKEFLVWFKENPMYAIVGGNIRYKYGITLSLAIPLLLSMNEGSKMNADYLAALDRRDVSNYPEIAYEVAHDIHDPFDPWFVKWKIVGSLTFPITYRITSAEIMRNFLLLKNTKRQNRLDIDNRLKNFELAPSPEPAENEDDEMRRLEEIEKRREEVKQK
jgi:hypothetical protein